MYKHLFDPTILRAYDIRGVFEKTLNKNDWFKSFVKNISVLTSPSSILQFKTKSESSAKLAFDQKRLNSIIDKSFLII